MRVLHTFCLNYNIGDYALGIGLKNLLRENFDIDLIGETNIQGREFNEYYINEVVNKKYELLVIGGGGIIHGSHWPNGWFWLINQDLIKQIKIPFIVYGVGYNYWSEEGGIPERGIKHLKETKNNALSFTVRNDGSQNRIFNQTGIKVSVVPDPGFHIDLNTDYQNFENGNKFVVIQLANDKPQSRFGSLNKRAEFVERMREVVKNLSKKYKVIFAPHVLDDVSISNNISKGINNTKVLNFGDFAFEHSNRMIGYYKYAEFAIAMRGHGQIIPIGFNTPVISLENHPKHIGLMRELNLLDYNVKVDSPDFKDQIMNKINLLEKNKTYLENQYKKINARLIKESNDAMQLLKKKL